MRKNEEILSELRDGIGNPHVFALMGRLQVELLLDIRELLDTILHQPPLEVKTTENAGDIIKRWKDIR